jgi:hypothetical protein
MGIGNRRAIAAGLDILGNPRFGLGALAIPAPVFE